MPPVPTTEEQQPSITPAAAPEAAATTPAESGASEEVNWSEFAAEDENLDGDEVAVEGDAAVVEPSAPSGSPAPTSATPAATPATPEATPPAAATQPPAAESTPPTTPSSPAAPEPAQVSYADWRNEQVTKLEQVYAMSPEAAQQMITEPELVLPKMAAQMHMHVAEAVFNAVTQALPQMVQGLQARTSVETKAEEMFYTANPDLKDPKFKDAIFKVGAMYRSVNKDAKPEDAVKAIGDLVRVSMGVQPVGATPPAVSAAPAVQAAPVARPHTPVRGGGGAVAPSQVQTNEFAKLAEEFLQED